MAVQEDGPEVSFDAYEHIADENDNKDNEYHPSNVQKKRPTQVANKLPPDQFLALFGKLLHEYAVHRRIAVHQTHQEQLLKEELLHFPVGSTPIIVDMDFAENYDIMHKVEVQSEHWNNQQATLFIVITHHRKMIKAADADEATPAEYRVFSEAHVYVSPDGGHDTHFVQHVMLDLQDHFRKRDLRFKQWFINTDGAASHFKQRFTFQSVFNFKTKAGADHVLWETCAPGHGKGPWDGIGAVVKRLLRAMEIKDKVYVRGALDIYNTLARHAESWHKKIGTKVMLDKFTFHYVPGKGEDTTGAALPEHVLTPISRPKHKPIVTAVPDIRSRFCFEFREGNKIATRALSCHCEDCLQRKYGECDAHKAMGKWKVTTIDFEQAGEIASKSSMRSHKARLSDLRRSAARCTKKGEVVALESKDDNEGFGFWLAEVVEPAVPHSYRNETVNGVRLVKGCYYATVKIIDRYPATSSTAFRLAPSQEPWKVNAEGVVLRNVQLQEVASAGVRKTRSAEGPKSHRARLFELSEDELQRCTEAAEEKLDPRGGDGHDNPHADTSERAYRKEALAGSRSLRSGW